MTADPPPREPLPAEPAPPSAAEPAPPPVAEPAPPPAGKPALRSLLSRALPLLSLASGGASALFMDRGSKRAAAVAAGTLAAWLSLVALHVILRFELKVGQLGRWARYLLWAARFSGMSLTQGMIQLGLFF